MKFSDECKKSIEALLFSKIKLINTTIDLAFECQWKLSQSDVFYNTSERMYLKRMITRCLSDVEFYITQEEDLSDWLQEMNR